MLILITGQGCCPVASPCSYCSASSPPPPPANNLWRCFKIMQLICLSKFPLDSASVFTSYCCIIHMSKRTCLKQIFVISDSVCGSGNWLGWMVLPQDLWWDYISLLARSCHHLKACLGLENLFPKWFIHMPGKLVLSLPCHLDLSLELLLCPHSTDWLPLKQVIPERAMPFVTYSGGSYTITSATVYSLEMTKSNPHFKKELSSNFKYQI